MAKIKNCIECDGKVSSEAGECPHCKTKYPHGVQCAVCCHVMKRAEARTNRKGHWVHHSCYEKIKIEEIKFDTIVCPACHTQVNGSPVDKCPKCGHPFSVKTCHYCELPVYEEKAKKWKEITHRYVITNCECQMYAHPLCAPAPSNKKCFIASAVCDPFAQELLVLRSFRYHYLEQSPLGGLFLRMYMQLSPHIAKIISKSPWVSLLVRNLLVKPTAKTIEWLFGRTILPCAKKCIDQRRV